MLSLQNSTGRTSNYEGFHHLVAYHLLGTGGSIQTCVLVSNFLNKTIIQLFMITSQIETRRIRSFKWLANSSRALQWIQDSYHIILTDLFTIFDICIISDTLRQHLVAFRIKIPCESVANWYPLLILHKTVGFTLKKLLFYPANHGGLVKTDECVQWQTL